MTTTEEIARSVQLISTAAQQSPAGVTQVSEAAHDLEALTSTLRQSVGRFELEERSSPPGGDRSRASGEHHPSHSGTSPSREPGWGEGPSVCGNAPRRGPLIRRGVPLLFALAQRPLNGIISLVE